MLSNHYYNNGTFNVYRTGELIEAKGYAVLNDPTDPDVPAQLIVNFESTPPEGSISLPSLFAIAL